MSTIPDWWIFKGDDTVHDDINKLPPPPPWRAKLTKQKNIYISDPKEIELVNAALYLRRPLLITGKPGTGKSSLADAVAYELNLGKVLRWPITTHTTLKDGLYQYDAIARLQDTSINKENRIGEIPDISKYLTLGPLGSAFASTDKPRVLLIDEIDKSDIDLHNNLLHIFEENEFEIPELARSSEIQHEVFLHEKTSKVNIKNGRIKCEKFPIVIMTSNGERDFPPAFIRRCLQLETNIPTEEKITKIINSHLNTTEADKTLINQLINDFLYKRDTESVELATDQLLNAIYLVLHKIDPRQSKESLLNSLWQSLSA
jgi:MoxR-like ATPase